MCLMSAYLETVAYVLGFVQVLVMAVASVSLANWQRPVT